MNQSQKNQINYWDHIAENTEFTHPFCFEQFEKLTSKSGNILDYGCGYGRIMNELHQHHYQNLVGLDFSKKLILKGKNLFPHLNFKIVKDQTIPYPNQYFDAIILFAVLTCIPDSFHQKNLFNEIHRVLKKNGIIYISDYLLQEDDKNIMRYQQFYEKYSCYGIFELPDGAILRHHSMGYVKELLSSFNEIWGKSVEVITMKGNRSIAFQYIGKIATS